MTGGPTTRGSERESSRKKTIQCSFVGGYPQTPIVWFARSTSFPGQVGALVCFVSFIQAPSSYKHPKALGIDGLSFVLCVCLVVVL
jgi:hypothetical protein